MSSLLAAALLSVGAFFFLAGTVGLLRFPDVYCRLHALTKADNLGLGCIAAALALLSDSWAERIQILLTWLLVLASTATIAHLLARSCLEDGASARASVRGPSAPGGAR